MPAMERSRDRLAQARRDLEMARLDYQKACDDLACFMAYQAAEKALKAVFGARGTWARGDSLLRLLQELEADETLLHSARFLDQILGRYYLQSIYPNGLPGSPVEPLDAVLAKEAINAADSILRFSSDHLG